jgi:molecular chaperone GrpE
LKIGESPQVNRKPLILNEIAMNNNTPTPREEAVPTDPSNPQDVATDAADGSADHGATAHVSLLAEVARLSEGLAAAKDDLLRSMAETENVRRRAAEDVQKAHKFGIEKFAKDLLGVKDSLDAGLAAAGATVETLQSGMEITQRQLQAVMERFAIVEIPAVAQRFDPNRHQAIGQVDSEQEPNTIVSCLQKGYLLHERVLRPSLVTIAKPKVSPPTTQAQQSA